MRIAFLTPEYVRKGHPDGGLANYLSKICALLVDRGHEPVVFLSGDEERAGEIDGVRIIETVRCRRNRLLLIWRDWLPQLRNSRRLAAAFLRENAKTPFDIVQSASFQAAGVALAGKTGVPIAARVSSLTPLLRDAEGIRTRLHDRLADRLEERQLRQADALFAPSAFIAGEVECRIGRRPAVIRSPFSLPACDEDDALYRKDLSGKRYLLFFGSLNRIKGIDVLAQALPGIFESASDIQVVCAGRAYNVQYPLMLKKGAGEDRERLHVLGVLPRETLRPIIRAADAVILPSRIDNYPNTCLEAQALGKIVIGTRGTSLDEMIEEGKTGFLAEPGSPQSLVEAVSRALNLDEKEKAKMERETRALSGDRDIDSTVDDLLEFYNRTIEQKVSKAESGQ